ncbi:MAG: caspase family protein [Deltaproteobacteria bacterium]|nr:caspase family protein [Deltaproteobacteria bacterium]
MTSPRVLLVMAAALVVVLAAARSAHADIERFAVVIGHNAGAADEQRLRFAETDAERVGELLGEVGGVPDENQVVLRGKTADQVRRALIATNERIRTGQRAGRQAVLFVYYSGHGDADTLHLGDTRFALRELEALVRGSSAQVRILVIDSCRSGSVTRVKGGTPAPAIALTTDALDGEGVIVLTASTAGEDAQESDELAGSFFTHYLLSGLRGAADDDGDQLVTVAEAFRYTRDHTILASARTVRGVQHPTFHYDLRGRADLALADLGKDRSRGRLTFPAAATWLVVREGAQGRIVGEIVASASRRTLSLRPGRYVVRGRTRDALLEGTVSVASGGETVVATGALSRTTYARLVRKGHGEILRGVAGPFGGAAIRSPIIDGASACVGAVAGWVWVRADVTFSPRVVGCRGEFSNRTLDATTDALALDLRVAKAWDLRGVTIDLGVTAGGEVLQQRFVTLGVAPTRTSAAAHVDAGLGAVVPLFGRLYLTSELAVQTHFLPIEDTTGARELTARFALYGVLAIGAWL